MLKRLLDWLAEPSVHREIIAWLMFVIALMAVFILWTLTRPEHTRTLYQTVDVPVAAKPLPALAQVAKAPVKLANCTVQVYAKAAKPHVSLPENLAKDANVVVADATEVKADDHPTEVVETLNAATGTTEMVVTRRPLPWLSFDRHYEIGAYAGYVNSLLQGTLEVRADLLQTKALHYIVKAELHQPFATSLPASADVEAGIAYRF